MTDVKRVQFESENTYTRKQRIANTCWKTGLASDFTGDHVSNVRKDAVCNRRTDFLDVGRRQQGSGRPIRRP